MSIYTTSSKNKLNTETLMNTNHHHHLHHVSSTYQNTNNNATNTSTTTNTNTNLPSTIRTSNSIYINYNNNNNNNGNNINNSPGVSSQPIQVRTTGSSFNNNLTYPYYQNTAATIAETNNNNTTASNNNNVISNYLYSSLSPPTIDHSSLINSINFNTTHSNQRNANDKQQHLINNSNDKVSAFLPYDEIILNDQTGSKNEIVCQIFNDVNAQEGHVDNIIRILSFHPTFLQEFIRFYNYLMYSQGALSYDARHYLAIMASARHNCIYLVKQQEKEFLMQNGQKSWLNGLNQIPQKLKDLNELNKILCHQPWLINRSHIDKILNGQFRWSITELIMAVTILTHFHALSGFVFGVGIQENYMQNLQLEHNLNEIKREAERVAAIIAAEKAAASHKQNMLNSGEFDDYDSDEEVADDDNDNLDDENDSSNLNSRIMNFGESEYCGGLVQYRHRSGSSSTVNRTLSNSSASSCELGIDMLLKEMQMIKADDTKNVQKSPSHHQLSSSLTSSSSMMNRINPSTSVPSASIATTNISGTNTITNSPISSSVTNGGHISSYLSDLSNCSTNSANLLINSPTSNSQHMNSMNKNQKSRAYNYNNYDNSLIMDEENINKSDDIDDSGMINDEDEDNENDQLTSPSSDSNNNKVNNHKYIKIKKSRSKQSSLSSSSIIMNNSLKPVASPSNTSTLTKNATNTSSCSDTLLNTSIVSAKVQKYLEKYEYDPDFGHLNFKKADPSLSLEYYTWENQGYITAFSFYPDICEFLDKNFKIAGNMTYNTMGSHKHVDTSLFRRAVWHYIHSLYGIRYDDYDYNQIKLLLASPLRNYIKILCRRPDKISKKDYDSIMKEFTHSEKVHVNIVIMEARIQASMLYFLRAINSYFG